MSVRVIDGRGAENLRPEYLPMFRLEMTGSVDDLMGDYSDEVKQYRAVQAGKAFRFVAEALSYSIAATFVEDHDPSGAQRFLATAPGISAESTVGHSAQIARASALENIRDIEMLGALDHRNWPRVLETARDIETEEPKLTASFNAGFYLPTQIWPYLAYAEAMSGDFVSAHTQIDRTPNDCDVCLRMRGRIDAVFAEPDGGATVVDWKTGERPHGSGAARHAAIQLGVYRLAWAALSDCRESLVRTAFHYVRTGLTVVPDALPGPDELAELLARETPS